MLGMTIDPGISAALLAFSVTVTLVANWLAAGLRPPTWPRRSTLADTMAVVASLVWILLVYISGVIATRYIDRTDYATLGYVAFGIGALALSWVRAVLYQGILAHQKQVVETDENPRWGFLIHSTSYLFFAVVLFLTLSWVLQRSAEPVFLVPLCIAALLPDLDSQTSLLGRLLPRVSRSLENRFGHLQEWHTPAANSIIAVLTTPLVLFFGAEPWYLLSLGFFSHLVLDMLAPQGIMLFWPITRTRYKILRGPVEYPGCRAERWLLGILIVCAGTLLLLVDVGPQPPPPSSAPTYEQTLERYYSMRGKNQMFAYIEGSWQATGTPMSGWLEILNAAGESYLMLDRYDGKVFSAGHGAQDNLYLNRITLRTGPSVRVKPTEVHLEDQSLAAGLGILYEMQREPGLEHIYISGDVVLPALQDAGRPILPTDHAQTSLRQIRYHDAGHYSFHYLTASEMIALADIQVQTADLVIVATYTSPADRPTVTPLPLLSSTPEPAQ